jgi:hypothetical protein
MRSFYVTVLSISLAFSSAVLACECGPAGPACAYVDRATVVFVGKVVFTDDDGSGSFVQKTLVHFEVEEAFKGLPEGIHDAWIDPGSYTSCYADYQTGSRYLVFGYGGNVMPPYTATMSVVTGRQHKNKPLPPGIDPAHLPTVYSSGECTGTRLIDSVAEKTVSREIDYLRQFKAGKAKSLITGSVLQDENFGIFDAPGLADVEVTITGENLHRNTKTDTNGFYSFTDLSAGSYTVTASTASYAPTRRAIEVDVPASGCGWATFNMVGSGTIKGSLLDHNGQPASRVKVTILRMASDGQPVYYGFKDTLTNSKGQYEFTKLPAGNFYIGVNIASAPDPEVPYPVTKWSDGGESAVHLDAGEHKALASFEIPAPLSKKTIPVRVLWPDGRSATGVDVWADVQNGIQDSVGGHGKTDATGHAQLELLEGINYTVEAKIWVGKGSYRKVARSGATQLNVGAAPANLILHLDLRTTSYN